MIEQKDIENLTMTDLVAYYNANKALKERYINEIHMNECYQNTKERYLYEEPLAKQLKCNTVESKIIAEFEKRLIKEEE
jgi:hypothetical protein